MPYCPACGREVREDNLFCPNCGRNLKQTAPPTAAIPQVTVGYDSDASTARSLTLVAMILLAVFFVIGILFFLFFFATAPFVTSNITFVQNGTTVTLNNPGNPVATPAFVFTIFGLVFGIGFLISVIWIALDYILIHRNLHSPETIPSARNPALILGILQLLFGGLIPGILLIIAYVKIGDSMRRRGQI